MLFHVVVDFFSYYVNPLVWKMFLKKYIPHMPLIGSIQSSAFEAKPNKKMQVREVTIKPHDYPISKQTPTDGATRVKPVVFHLGATILNSRVGKHFTYQAQFSISKIAHGINYQAIWMWTKNTCS